MKNFPEKGRSALSCQLKQEGTPGSFEALCKTMKTMSRSEISDLEEELSFYAETGLVGIQMSRLLPIISKAVAIEAA